MRLKSPCRNELRNFGWPATQLPTLVLPAEIDFRQAVRFHERDQLTEFFEIKRLGRACLPRFVFPRFIFFCGH